MSGKDIVVRIADITFGIRCQYGFLPTVCEPYLSTESPEFWLSASDEEIVAEQELAEDPIGLDLAESSAILKKLGEKLLSYDGFLLH